MLVIALLGMLSADAPAQDKAFGGGYAGVEVGRQSIIGGSLVGGVDMLSQDGRAVVSLLGGARYQFGFGLVVGVEGSVGFMDGDLRLADPGAGLQIDYETRSQTSLGVLAGYALGPARTWLLFGYLSEATRTFDVTIQQTGVVTEQRDEQGMLRYGVGAEIRILGGLHVRASGGSGRADFADRQTNIEPERELELALGVLYQF